MAKALVLLLALAVCVAGQANNATPKRSAAVTVADASFPDWAAGIAAANTTASNLTTLLAAVQAAGEVILQQAATLRVQHLLASLHLFTIVEIDAFQLT
jgi:hypothetical protein